MIIDRLSYMILNFVILLLNDENLNTTRVLNTI